MKACAAAGVPVLMVMVMPWASSFCATSGSLSAALISSLSRSTISDGVLPGASTAHQAGASKPAKPLSATVGMSAKVRLRWAVATASGRRRWRWLSMWGLDTKTEPTASGTWPALASLISGPPPR